MSELSFGYTAFARDDQDDAARRRPSHSLAEWAQSRGLDYRGQELPSAFLSVLPEWPEHLMNLAQGPFPGSRLGVIAQRLYELETWEGSIRSPGDFWGTRLVTRRSWKSLIGISVDESNGPFDGNRIFAPTTTAVVRAPEAALLPRILIRSEGRLVFGGNPRLGDFGLDHLRFSASQFIDDELLAAIAIAVAPTLATWRDPFVEFVYSYGVVSLTVNGYRHEAGELDRLMYSASALADALGSLASTRWPVIEPRDFNSCWGPVNKSAQPVGFHKNMPEWDDAYDRVSGELQLHLEDPSGYHRHLPHCPIPGVAEAVLWGPVPGRDDSETLRLSWHVQGGYTSGWVRPAACFPVPTSVPDGPVGGVLDPTTDMYLEVRDGLAFVWARARIAGRLDSAQLLASAAGAHERLVGG